MVPSLLGLHLLAPESSVDGAEEAVAQLLAQLQLGPGQLPHVRPAAQLPSPGTSVKRENITRMKTY